MLRTAHGWSCFVRDCWFVPGLVLVKQLVDSSLYDKSQGSFTTN